MAKGYSNRMKNLAHEGGVILGTTIRNLRTEQNLIEEEREPFFDSKMDWNYDKKIGQG